jgi:hypothetical protein
MEMLQKKYTIPPRKNKRNANLCAEALSLVKYNEKVFTPISLINRRQIHRNGVDKRRNGRKTEISTLIK